MDSELKIKYHISDMFGGEIETDSLEEALASFEEGRLVYEAHVTTWTTGRWMSGKNEVRYEWY